MAKPSLSLCFDKVYYVLLFYLIPCWFLFARSHFHKLGKIFFLKFLCDTYTAYPICISGNSGGSNKLPDDGRLLPKHVGANTVNKGVVQSVHLVGTLLMIMVGCWLPSDGCRTTITGHNHCCSGFFTHFLF
jgi:hypothetical protein